jgi:hypothetical protein
MTFRYLYILIIIFFANSGNSQICYDPNVLQDFVNVYMTHKTEKKKNLVTDGELFKTYNVSPQRYRAIAKAALNNDPLTLNANEELLIEETKKQNVLLNIKNQETLEKLCSDHEIPIELYTTLLKKYKSEIQFQRSLKPYFDTYIKRLK